MNKNKIAGSLFVVALMLYCNGCVTTEPINLHVAFFPYIPDAAGDHFSALSNHIRTEFEAENPDVRLVLDPIDPNSSVFYDYDSLKMLMNPASPNGQADLVEIDTLFLGKFVKDDYIEAWNSLPRESDWHPAAKSAVTVNGNYYGVPHWLCSFFVFSHLPDTAKAKTAKDFTHILDIEGAHETRFAGNFAGSFTLPAIYLDAYVETHGSGSAKAALAKPIDERVVSSIKLITDEGAHNGKNPCLDGSLKDDKDINAVVPAFAKGDIDSFFGYSERLFHILKGNPKVPAYTIIAAPLGQGERPLLYVDAFVLRKGVSKEKRMAARAFADYINRPETQEWILLSKDGHDVPPRYLLPATKSAFDAPGLKSDAYYQMLKKDIAGGDSQPTSGYLERKDELKTNILSKLLGK